MARRNGDGRRHGDDDAHDQFESGCSCPTFATTASRRRYTPSGAPTPWGCPLMPPKAGGYV